MSRHGIVALGVRQHLLYAGCVYNGRHKLVHAAVTQLERVGTHAAHHGHAGNVRRTTARRHAAYHLAMRRLRISMALSGHA